MKTFVKGSRFTVETSGTDQLVKFGLDTVLTIDTTSENAVTLSKPITGVEMLQNYTDMTIQLSATETATIQIDRQGNLSLD